MNDLTSYKLTYSDMRELVHQYFKAQGREVKLVISNEIDTDRFAGTVVTTMQLNEKTTFAGIPNISVRTIDIEDLKEIIQVMSDQDGKEIVNITNNAVVTSKTKGYGMGEHSVEKISNKSFTVSARTKKKNHTK